MKKQWLILSALAIIIISATVFLLKQRTVPKMAESNKGLRFNERGNKGDVPTNTEYTVLFSHDFDDLGLLPRGDYDPEDDPGWNSPKFDNKRPISTMAIVTDGTDTVFAHYYDKGHCGDQPKVDWPTFSYATGTYFATFINSDPSIGYDDIYFSFNMKTSPGFYPGEHAHVFQEMKIPGLQSESGDHPNGAKIRLRWDNFHTPGTGYLSWMTKIAETYPSSTESLVGDFTDTIEVSGAWQNFCMRVSTNTGNNKDGLIEFFKDGILVGSQTTMQLVANGDLFNKILISTAGGGSGNHHTFETDMYIYFDDFVVWEGGPEYPARGEPSEKNRILDMPRECELNKQQK